MTGFQRDKKPDWRSVFPRIGILLEGHYTFCRGRISADIVHDAFLILEKAHRALMFLTLQLPPACGDVRQNQKLARTTDCRSAPDRRIAVARRAAALRPCAAVRRI